MDAALALVMLVALVLIALGAFVVGLAVGRPGRRSPERRAEGSTAWMRIGGGGF